MEVIEDAVRHRLSAAGARWEPLSHIRTVVAALCDYREDGETMLKLTACENSTSVAREGSGDPAPLSGPLELGQLCFALWLSPAVAQWHPELAVFCADSDGQHQHRVLRAGAMDDFNKTASPFEGPKIRSCCADEQAADAPDRAVDNSVLRHAPPAERNPLDDCGSIWGIELEDQTHVEPTAPAALWPAHTHDDRPIDARFKDRAHSPSLVGGRTGGYAQREEFFLCTLLI